MVATAASTRKRKQPDTVDDSPPKRVTRARSAKTVDNTSDKVETKRITTASARAASASKTAAKATTTAASKKKTRVVDTQTTEQKDEPEEKARAEETKKTRGRAKKPVEPPVVPEPKSTARRARAAVETEAAAKAPKPRTTRAKKTVEEAEENMESVPDELAEEATKPQKATRGRAAATKAKTEVPAKKAASKTKPDVPERKTATTRKKVTFEEDKEQDKENAKLPSILKKTKSVEESGLRAKPVRKAPTTRSTRGKKEAESKTTSSARGRIVKPLSPKKVTQVAKSTSSGSEDELCDKSPVRMLARSPTRPPAALTSPQKSPSKPHQEQISVPQSPTKNLAASVLASPAKRLPASPFKAALNDSPKRINLFTSMNQVQLNSSQSPLKGSLMKESPKRVHLAPGGAQSLTSTSRSAFQTSLLQSPARRPSPCKAEAARTPSVIQDAGSVKPSLDGSEEPSERGLTQQSAQKLFISPQRLELHHDEENVLGAQSPCELGRSPTPQRSPSPVRNPPMPERQSPLKNAALFGDVRSPSKGLQNAWYAAEDSDSEDELQSGPATMSPRKDRPIFGKPNLHDRQRLVASDATPKMLVFGEGVAASQTTETFDFTPLALQLSTWCASSPQKNSDLAAAPVLESASTTPTQAHQNDLVFDQVASANKPTFFEDEMTVHEQEPISILEDREILHLEDPMDIDTVPLTEEARVEASQEMEQYGDENTVPIDPEMFLTSPEGEGRVTLGDQEVRVTVQEVEETQAIVQQESETEVPTPEELEAVISPEEIQAAQIATEEAQEALNAITPIRPFRVRPKEIHTVSKVPLRAADDGVSPIRVPRKRSKSTNARPLEEVLDLSRLPISIGEVPEPETEQQFTPARKVSIETSMINALLTPAKGTNSAASSPLKSVRKGEDAQILRGAVVHVDVHTSEGADASGIFIELLTQMGARCVKQWTWNSRSSSVGRGRNGSPSAEATPTSKVGITHVVFKDGSKRTLQKVRDARGLVVCVGVGWVLDCERENKWLDEAEYAVDTSTIPRGGHNRRKSMEPRSLSNINGNLVAAETPGKGAAEPSSSTKDFLNFSMSSRRDSIRVPTRAELQTPTTPTPAQYNNNGDEASSWGSPTTPYFLSKGAMLVQQTCPPKQTMQGLFPVSGRIEDQPDESVRQRLIMARRKSLQWAPKVGSPLGRAVSYGK